MAQVGGVLMNTLFKNDGTTQITNGTFITVAEGNAGLKFTPTADFNGSGSFTQSGGTLAITSGSNDYYGLTNTRCRLTRRK